MWLSPRDISGNSQKSQNYLVRRQRIARGEAQAPRADLAGTYQPAKAISGYLSCDVDYLPSFHSIDRYQVAAEIRKSEW